MLFLSSLETSKYRLRYLVLLSRTKNLVDYQHEHWITSLETYNKRGPGGKLLHGKRPMSDRRRRINPAGFHTTIAMVNLLDICIDLIVIGFATLLTLAITFVLGGLGRSRLFALRLGLPSVSKRHDQLMNPHLRRLVFLFEIDQRYIPFLHWYALSIFLRIVGLEEHLDVVNELGPLIFFVERQRHLRCIRVFEWIDVTQVKTLRGTDQYPRDGDLGIVPGSCNRNGNLLHPSIKWHLEWNLEILDVDHFIEQCQ
jgi:hypothetical protein